MNIKKIIIYILKFSFVVGIFYWLSQKNWISVDAIKLGLNHPQNLIIAAIALVSSSLLGAFRWQILLNAQKLSVKLSRSIQLTWIGYFFNIALPGAVSGDIIKAIYVAKEEPGSRAKAMGSILFDRIIGLTGLILVSFFSMFTSFEHFQQTPVLKGIQFFIILLMIGVCTVFTYLFIVRDHWDPFLLVLKKIESKIKRFGSITRIYLGIRTYHHQKSAVLAAIGISVVIQFLCSFACLNFIRALEDTAISVNSVFVLSPLGLLATAIPVMPGGIGTGHAAFGLLYNQVQSMRGADVFSFYVIIQIITGAVGGLVYLRFKEKSAPATEVEGAL
jgi:uncharacterized protein (TIRG00374 family)